MGEASPSLKPVFTVFPYPLCGGTPPQRPQPQKFLYFSKQTKETMSLILTIIFFAWFVSNIVRGNVSHQGSEYGFREHPVQFIIIQVFILGFGLFCLNRFLNEMGIYLF